MSNAAPQLPLFDRWQMVPLQQRWREFHAANPHVYAHFERLALKAAQFRVRFGAKAIWEVMRWEMAINTTEAEPKLNNSYTAYYAREFVRRHPEHTGLFEMRERG